MAYEIVIAMNVVDTPMYERYREAMRPILEAFGGAIVYDLVVERVLKSPAAHPITRVFSIRFPSRAQSAAFFGDAGYLAARAKYFEASVAGYSVMAEVEG